MNLNPNSIEWALKHLYKYSDTDLFPKPLEYDALNADIPKLSALLSGAPIGNFRPQPARRFVVPKAEFAFRQATQLYPTDSLLLSSIIYEFGAGIEKRRPSPADEIVFSNRFRPLSDGTLYDPAVSWAEFWTKVQQTSPKYPAALVVDITDYYNQIYHHTLENQLAESGFPNAAIKWVLALLESLTAKVSRGIPVGPHAAHLLAELALVPIDNQLRAEGFKYCRYADDFVIFCDGTEDPAVVLNRFAEILDKQQRLGLQKSKTQVLSTGGVLKLAEEMLQDRPISEIEKQVLGTIRKHSGGNPYHTVNVAQFGPVETKYFERPQLEGIISEYLKSSDPDFSRLRWFYRRLAQTGAPNALDFTLNNLEKLTPAISDVCHYLISVGNSGARDWKQTGETIHSGLRLKRIASSEYFQISLLSLFARNPGLNHFDKLSGSYKSYNSNLRREVILAAQASGHGDWIRILKEDFRGMDIWCQNAFIMAVRCLPREERRFFLNSLGLVEPTQKLLADWAAT